MPLTAWLFLDKSAKVHFWINTLGFCVFRNISSQSVFLSTTLNKMLQWNLGFLLVFSHPALYLRLAFPDRSQSKEELSPVNTNTNYVVYNKRINWEFTRVTLPFKGRCVLSYEQVKDRKLKWALVPPVSSECLTKEASEITFLVASGSHS